MKLILLVMGVTDDRELAPVTERYVKRLGHYAPFHIQEVKAPRHFAKLGIEELKKAEGALLLSEVSEQDTLVLLDERGVQRNSVDFSAQLQKWMNAGGKRIVFVVGGAYGFPDSVYQRADHRMALSAMTLTHQMVRLFFVEQLYRAFTILRNEKYHH